MVSDETMRLLDQAAQIRGYPGWEGTSHAEQDLMLDVLARVTPPSPKPVVQAGWVDRLLRCHRIDLFEGTSLGMKSITDPGVLPPGWCRETFEAMRGLLRSKR